MLVDGLRTDSEILKTMVCNMEIEGSYVFRREHSCRKFWWSLQVSRSNNFGIVVWVWFCAASADTSGVSKIVRRFFLWWWVRIFKTLGYFKDLFSDWNFWNIWFNIRCKSWLWKILGGFFLQSFHLIKLLISMCTFWGMWVFRVIDLQVHLKK